MREKLPDGWAPTTLGEVVDKPRSKAAPSEYPDLPFVGMDSIAPGGMSLLSVGRFGDMKSAGGIFERGDVLYGRMRPYLNKVHLARERGACSAEFIVMPASDRLDGGFLAYLLHQRPFVNFASAQSSGDRPRVDFESLASFRFGLPPKREQQRIVSRIDELFSEIDEGERALERAQKLVERYRQSVLKAAVTGNLTVDWLAHEGGQSHAGVCTAEAFAIEKPSVPASWRWVPLGKLIKSGPQNGVYLHQSQYGSGCPILRIDDFQPGWVRPAGELRRVNADDEIRTCYSLRESDVVVNRVNSPSHLGKCLVVSGQHEGALFESNMMRFRVDECLLPRYLELYLRSELGRRRLTANCKHAVNQASINQKDVASTLVPLPTVDEQIEIVNRASKALSDSEAAVAVLEESQQQSAALRQCILKAAFSGQLVPQGPTDEPASALLARFAEEATDAPATERRRASRARSKSPTA